MGTLPSGQHFNHKETAHLVWQFGRILSENGCLVVTKEADSSSQCLRESLEEAGFAIVESHRGVEESHNCLSFP